MSERLDAVVVGAGAVGLAVAERLSRGGRSVAVLERHARHGLETSSRSSEVVHAGFYYKTGSLKARLCVAGRRALYDLAEKRGFFARRVGKLVVAADASQVPKLEALHKQGLDNGVEGLRLLEGREIKRHAEGVRGTAALWSAETGIMDTEGLMEATRHAAESNGAMLAFGGALERVEPETGGYALWTKGESEPVRARVVFNAAGLFADKVAALAGLEPGALGYRVKWFKGEYFSLKRRLPPACLVYPLPGPHGLGIHLTVDARGRQRLGPNAFPVSALDYDVDAAHAQSFYEAASSYLEGLRPEDLAPGTSGIRPKLASDGSFRDFVIAEESARGLPGWVNLVGIESPGLTASPAIADFVADLLGWGA
jgi:L-2-hydroxyglutarate oxidase LhgO